MSLEKKNFIPILIFLFLSGCGVISSNPSEVELQATMVSIEATTESVRATSSVTEANNDATQTPSVSQILTPPATNDISQGDLILEDIVPLPLDETLFFDDFSSNKYGWNLQSSNVGDASLVQSSLRLSANNGECMIMPIPDVTIDDNFYIEVTIELFDQVNILNNAEEYVGIAFGDLSSDYGRYGFWITRDYTNIHFSTPSGAGNLTTLWNQHLKSAQKFTIAIEAINGSYSILYNGESLETLVRNFPGDSLGLFTCNIGSGSQTHFDDLLVREFR